jgi:hypothetical protein
VRSKTAGVASGESELEAVSAEPWPGVFLVDGHLRLRHILRVHGRVMVVAKDHFWTRDRVRWFGSSSISNMYGGAGGLVCGFEGADGNEVLGESGIGGRLRQVRRRTSSI